MTHLTSSVVEIPQCKREDVVLCFLNGNEVYLKSRSQGKDRSVRYWKINVTRLNQKISVDSSQWPKLPKFEPTTWQKEWFMFGKWWTERSPFCKRELEIDGVVTWRGGKPRVITSRDRRHEFLKAVDLSMFCDMLKRPELYESYGVSKAWVEAAALEAEQIIEHRNKQLYSKFVPMREAGEEMTSVIAGILNFDGEPKQLVQGLKKIGIEIRGEWKRNFVTKGLMVDNLEVQLFSGSRSEDPT